MSYRESNDADGRNEAFEPNRLPMTLDAEVRTAFREWLDASKAWSTLRQAVGTSGCSSKSRRKLEELERRVNRAADVYREAQQRNSDSPPYASAWKG